MKKSIAFLLFLLPFVSNAQQAPCIPPVTLSCDSFPNYIDSVVFTDAIIPNNYVATGCNGWPQNYHVGGYGVMDDGNDSFRIRVGVNPNLAAYIGIWIDWNDNMTFEANEEIYMSSAPETHVALTVHLPNIWDTLILRVRCGNTLMDACSAVTSGETEDYGVTIFPVGIHSWSVTEWSFTPNPAEDNLVITFGKPINALITIRDVSGQIVSQQTTSQQRTSVDVSGLARGVYFIQVEAEGQSAVERFVH
jgi:hypothetical protein